jgi:hypothetical protein
MTEPSPAADQWSWKDFIPVAPMVAGAFAFAYVVGYFLSFDIAWFPFFTLSEHVVFALRALPIAIGLSFVFLIAFEVGRAAEEGWLKHWLTYAWITFLLGTAVGIFQYNHAGLALTLVFIAIGGLFYHLNPAIRTPVARFLLSATNMMLVSVIVGVFSGSTWRLPYLQSDSRAMGIKVGANPEYSIGHVIFAGGDNILFYEFETKTQSGATHLYRWADVKDIVECSTSEDCTKRLRKSTKR